MKSIAARDAKNGFGHLIDLARAEPVMIEKHGRPVVVVLSVEEFTRLNASDRTECSSTFRAEVRRKRAER
ncbi:MAG: prevent-host-death protein [Hyphomicrobium sp. 32-62-53]|nr:MAG: prevent-host-death protein [Hyphomicrobium sp. 12-62-95]OYX98043.1 MAG: prevent-host-death protein [Hyphomicrobium sp. 32-62-53]